MKNMKKAFKSLVQQGNLLHMFFNLGIILASTMVMSIDSVKAMLIENGMHPEVAVMVSSAILLVCKEILIKYQPHKEGA